MNGTPLTSAEQADLKSLMEGEKECDSSTVLDGNNRCQPSFVRWQEAVRDFDPNKSEAVPPTPVYNQEDYTYSSVVYGDAWLHAAKTYWDRKRKWGEGTPQLKEWMTGQQSVFALERPRDLEESADPLLKANRAYQQAAFYFYSGNYAAAVTAFLTIAADPSSEWRTWGKYLAARSKLRSNSLAEAKSLLDEIIADSSLSERHRASKRLLSHIHFRSNYEEAVLATFASLQNPTADRPFADSLRDLAFLARQGALGKYGRNRWPSLDSSVPPLIEWLSATWRSSGFFLFPRRSDESQLETSTWRSGVVESWKRHPDSVPWIVSALSAIQPNDSAVEELLGKAANIPLSSPAGPTIRLHQVRLYLGRGDRPLARRLLKEVLGDARVSASSKRRQPFSELELLLSESEDHLVALLELSPFNYYDGCYELEQMPEIYDRDRHPELSGSDRYSELSVTALQVLNRGLPISRLLSVATHSSLSLDTRSKVAFSAWARAVILHKELEALEAARAVISLHPSLEKEFAPFQKAKDQTERTRYAVASMLRNPDISAVIPFHGYFSAEPITASDIGPYGNIWWCGLDITSSNQSAIEGLDALHTLFPPVGDGFIPDFLTEEEQRTVRDEIAGLAAIGSPGSLFLRVVESWAKDDRMAPELPELLHRFVFVGRWSKCDHGVGQPAFRLLHKWYRKSEWAKKTPYYY